MSYEAIIAEMRAKPINVCYTNIIVGHYDHRYPWENPFQSRHWDDLIAMKAHKPFAKTADLIYRAMDKDRQHFPIVTRFHSKFTMVYRDGDAEVKWDVHDDGTFTFVLTHNDEPVTINSTNLESIAKFASDFLNGDIAVLKGGNLVSSN